MLFQGDQASTQAVLDQEQRIIGFARAGKGTCRPLAAGRDRRPGWAVGGAGSRRAACLEFDRPVMLMRGGAGTGKTTMMTPALAQLGVRRCCWPPRPSVARQAAGGRIQGRQYGGGVPRRKDMQEKARGGIIWIDEAGLLAIDDLDRVCALAKALECPHRAAGRSHASIKPCSGTATCSRCWRTMPGCRWPSSPKSSGRRATMPQAVAAIRDGRVEKGVDTLCASSAGSSRARGMTSWSRDTPGRGRNGEQKTVLVIDPTHKDGDALSEKLREVRKARG